MSFDYFSKRRMQYILEKLKTIFDTKANASDVPQNLSDLSDVAISSPSNNQIPMYNGTSHKWQNQNLPSSTDLFTIAVTSGEDPETGETTYTANKLPSEVISAYNNGDVIQLVVDSGDVEYYFTLGNAVISEDESESETGFMFQRLFVYDDEDVGFGSFILVKEENVDAWNYIEFVNNFFVTGLTSLTAIIDEDNNVYTCDTNFEDMENAYYASKDIFVKFDSRIFKLAKYVSSTHTFYFTSTIADANGIDVKTFVMIGNQLTNSWTSIALTASSGAKAFLVTITNDATTHDPVCDKTPSEVMSAIESGSIIRARYDYSEGDYTEFCLYDLSYYYTEDTSLELYFSSSDSWNDGDEVMIETIELSSDDLTTWSNINTITTQFTSLNAELSISNGVYHCNATPEEFENSIASKGKLQVTDITDGTKYVFSKKSNGIYYFTSTNASDLNQLSVKTFIMTPNNNNSNWTSINLVESNGSNLFMLTLSRDSSTHALSCNKTPTEVVGAYGSRNMLEAYLFESEAKFYKLSKYLVDELNNTLTIQFTRSISSSSDSGVVETITLSATTGNAWSSITESSTPIGRFLVTISEDETTHEPVCDKLPSELLAAYTNGNVIQALLSDYDNMFDLVACALTDDPYKVIFSATCASSPWETLSLSLVLTKDSSTDTWDDIEVNQHNLHYHDVTITKSGNVYSCSTSPSLLIDAIDLGIGAKVISTEDNRAYVLSKIDSANKTYYFTSNNVDSSGNLTTSTFVMVSNQNEGAWTSITRYDNNSSDAIKWSEAEKSVKKNWLKNEAVTTTIHGITFTVNSDGTITANGTATAEGANLIIYSNNNQSCPYNGYILSGCPSGGGYDKYDLRISDVTTGSVQDYGNGATISVANTGKWNASILIRAYQEVSNLVFRPMIRLASVQDSTYVPYIPNNTELVDWKSNGILGAKNLLPTNISNKTYGGITITVNSDGGINVNGTATEAISFDVCNYYNLPLGDYILTGTPYGGSQAQFKLVLTKDGGGVGDDIGNGYRFSVTSTSSNYKVQIRVPSEMIGVAGNKTFYPMIRLAIDTDPTYSSYAMSNRQLTELMPVWSSSVSALTGATSVTITNANIHTSSVIEPFAENGTNTAMAMPTMTVTEGQCVLGFDALAADTTFKLRITN